jgi:putative oxidoreductase
MMDDGKRGHTMNQPGIVAKWISMGPQFLSLLRIVAAAIFLTSGTTILFAFPAGMPPDGKAVGSLMTQVGIGGLLEAVGGLLLLVGLFTRPVAFVMAGEMAVAYFQFHFPASVWPTINQGVAAILYCFVWLYISAAGPGPWSIDAARRRA